MNQSQHDDANSLLAREISAHNWVENDWYAGDAIHHYNALFASETAGEIQALTRLINELRVTDTFSTNSLNVFEPACGSARLLAAFKQLQKQRQQQNHAPKVRAIDSTDRRPSLSCPASAAHPPAQLNPNHDEVIRSSTGWQVGALVGFDLSADAIDLAQRELNCASAAAATLDSSNASPAAHKDQVAVWLWQDDMACFKVPFDAPRCHFAFNLVSSIGHLAEIKDFRCHFDCMHKALLPQAHYVVGLTLVQNDDQQFDYTENCTCEEAELRGLDHVSAIYSEQSLRDQSHPGLTRQHHSVYITVREPQNQDDLLQPRRLVSHMTMSAFTICQLRDLCASIDSQFALVRVHEYSTELDEIAEIIASPLDRVLRFLTDCESSDDTCARDLESILLVLRRN